MLLRCRLESDDIVLSGLLDDTPFSTVRREAVELDLFEQEDLFEVVDLYIGLSTKKSVLVAGRL